MKVWLVGAEGMLGHAFSSRLSAEHVNLTTTDREVDITDGELVKRFAIALRPDWIVNVAAYTDVDAAERDEGQALRVNGDGPAHLVTAAREAEAGLVHFSTDHVFDGAADAPYEEDAVAAPRNAYGRTKLAGEQCVLAALARGLRGYVVRTSWLFGGTGKNFVTTMLRLMAEPHPLRVVNDQWGRPTYSSDLAEATWRLVTAGAEPGIYHFANSEPTTWHGFARQIYEFAGEMGFPVTAPMLLPVTTAEYPRPAHRPANSVLSTQRYARFTHSSPRGWALALREYLGKLRSEVA